MLIKEFKRSQGRSVVIWFGLSLLSMGCRCLVSIYSTIIISDILIKRCYLRLSLVDFYKLPREQKPELVHSELLLLANKSEDKENNKVCFVSGSRWGKLPSHMYYSDSALQRSLTRFNIIENRVRVGLNSPLNCPEPIRFSVRIRIMGSMQQLCLI